MTHLPFVMAAYALGVLIPTSFAISAFLRVRSAMRRLAALDRRRRR